MTGNREAVQAMYDAFARGDIPAVLDGLDAQVEWIEPEGSPLAGTYRGPDAVLQNVFMRLGTDWDGFSVTPHQLVGSGDLMVMLGEYGGTHKATGKSIRGILCAHAATWRDGKVVRFVVYFDTLMFQRALQP